MSDTAPKPNIDHYELTYYKGKTEKVNADYYQQQGPTARFVNFKLEGGATVYAVRVEELVSIEAIYVDAERFVTR